MTARLRSSMCISLFFVGAALVLGGAVPLASAQSSSRVQGSVTRQYGAPQNYGAVQPGSATRVQPGVVIEQGSAIRSDAIGQAQAQPVQVQQGSGTTIQRPVYAQATFEDRFWGYLNRAKYRNWAPVPGQSDAMYEGQSPHGAYLKMYLNRTAAGNPSALPNRSIIIKENYGPDQKTLMAITVMYKTKGFDASAGDWYWVKYKPDGTVDQKSTPTGNVRLAGRVKGCIACHADAGGNDFTFFND